MKFTSLALAALSAIVSAQTDAPWYDVQSNGFRLMIKSDNSTLNGRTIGACHQGAAIEGMCLAGQITDPVNSYSTFYHNVSSAQNQPMNANDTYGVLNYVLFANGGSLKVPSAMRFNWVPGSNIADMYFSPGWDDFTRVAFEPDSGDMYIEAYQNDTASPITYYSPALKLKNWYICTTRFSYTYVSLVWKVGVTGEPQNPTCVKVGVERVWV